MRKIDRTSLRDGFALPTALLALVVIGAIVTGGFYASSQEHRISLSSDLASQAFYVAEFGLDQVLATSGSDDIQELADHPGMAIEDSVVVAGQPSLGEYSVTVDSVGVLYLVRSEGTVVAGRDTATRSVARIVRRTVARLPYTGALTIYGGIAAGGNSQINGEPPADEPDRCPAGSPAAAVTAKDTAQVDEGNQDRITGEPDVAGAPEMDTTTLNDFGAGIDINALIAMATKVFEGGETLTGMGPKTTISAAGDTTCNTTDPLNWGDPGWDSNGPCADEFPIIHAKGDLSLSTGTGQGILIVDGDLRATGNFDFYGIVIVRGSLFTAGTGNHLEGSVIVKGQGELNSESTTTGNSLVQFSKCRVEGAFGRLPPRPLDERSWIDISSVTGL